MNAQGLDPFHTSGSDTKTRQMEHDAAVRGQESRPASSQKVGGASMLRQVIRRLIQRRQ